MQQQREMCIRDRYNILQLMGPSVIEKQVFRSGGSIPEPIADIKTKGLSVYHRIA